MKVTLKDGSVKEYQGEMMAFDIAMDISEGLARAACAVKIDGKVCDLRTTVNKDCTLEILTGKDEEGLRVLRHTASHVLAEAVRVVRPNVKVAIGPAIENGFYYDFDTEPFSREDLDKIEAEMKKIIKKGERLTYFELPRAEAIKKMEDLNEPYKVELIKDLPEDAIISFYSQGEGFTDLCAGPHLMNTKGVKAFKLISSSMAFCLEITASISASIPAKAHGFSASTYPVTPMAAFLLRACIIGRSTTFRFSSSETDPSEISTADRPSSDTAGAPASSPSHSCPNIRTINKHITAMEPATAVILSLFLFMMYIIYHYADMFNQELW